MHKISDYLRRLWTIRLGEEHRRICWQYGLVLRQPLIELIDSSTKWGAFRGLQIGSIIQISEGLITGYSWDVVIQVIKHEMAHQFVFEDRGIASGHDREFMEAAQRLGLDERFAAASGDLPRTFCPTGQNLRGEQNLHAKVKKLLRLASSENANEAQLALRKAGLLIARYNLDILTAENPTPVEYRIIPLKRKRLSSEQRAVCALLRQHFFVEVVLSSQYDAASATEWKTVELVGSPANLDNAEYIFQFLQERLLSNWRQYRCRKGGRQRSRKGFMLGMLDGFAKQYEKSGTSAVEREAERTVALALRSFEEDEDIKSLLLRRYPRLAIRKGKRSYIDADAYDAGHAKGRTLTLVRAVERTAGKKRKLLGR